MISRPCILIIIGLSVISSFSKLVNGNSSQVETPKGTLVGKEFFSRNGRSYLAFRGVPYGKKPERFQVAEPFPSWTESRNAMEFGNSCPHMDILSRSIVGDEDCLFLNVYVMKNEGKRLPVMVWIHGGGFEAGRSNDYDAKYFMDEDIVLVTINYRLGALGFLSTEDSVVPGNMGMKDQVLALTWVQENIQSFGGDPNRVTIAGSSAGGAAVHYHLMSPMSKGLFRAAISQGGSAFCPWAFVNNPNSIATTFGKHLSCPTDSSQLLIDCLKTKDPKEIVAAQQTYNLEKRWGFFPFNSFAPVVESQDSQEPKFLSETPEKAMLSGKINRVPWIVGFNEDEGVTFSPLVMMSENLTRDMNEEWNRVAPIVLNYDHVSPLQVKNEISTKVYNFYFETEEVGEETWQILTDVMSDRFFVHGIDKAAKLYAKYAPVYPYVFTFPGGDSVVLRLLTGITGDYGVGHADEVQYQFNGFYGSPEYVDEEKHEVLDISRKFVKLWASFVETSVPTATWKDVTEWKPIASTSEVDYYQIFSKTSIWDGDNKDRMALWNELSKTIDTPQKKSPGSGDHKDEL